MDTWGIILITTIVTSVATVFGSAGFWSYAQRKGDRRTDSDILLMGLAQDKIVKNGLEYIARGWLILDEYEDYEKVYLAYKAKGGNGVTGRIFAEVQNLPIKPRAEFATVLQEAKKASPTYEHPPAEPDPLEQYPSALQRLVQPA